MVLYRHTISVRTPATTNSNAGLPSNANIQWTGRARSVSQEAARTAVRPPLSGAALKCTSSDTTSRRGSALERQPTKGGAGVSATTELRVGVSDSAGEHEVESGSMFCVRPWKGLRKPASERLSTLTLSPTELCQSLQRSTLPFNWG